MLSNNAVGGGRTSRISSFLWVVTQPLSSYSVLSSRTIRYTPRSVIEQLTTLHSTESPSCGDHAGKRDYRADG